MVIPRVQRRCDLGVRLPLRQQAAPVTIPSSVQSSCGSHVKQALPTEADTLGCRVLCSTARSMACVGQEGAGEPYTLGTDLHAALVPVAFGVYPQRIQQHDWVRPSRLW